MRKPLVLILCTGNSCRSQMAEAFCREFHAKQFDVASAGTEPAAEVHPLAVEVMLEAGFDLSEQRPKHLRDFLGRVPVRHILIVCDKATNTCPRIWPGVVSRTSLPFDDPASLEGPVDERLEVFRRVRDEIEIAMRSWTPDQTPAIPQ